MEYDDPRQPQAPWPPRSKVKVARSRDQSEPSCSNAVPASLEAGRGADRAPLLTAVLDERKLLISKATRRGWMEAIAVLCSALSLCLLSPCQHHWRKPDKQVQYGWRTGGWRSVGTEDIFNQSTSLAHIVCVAVCTLQPASDHALRQHS